MEEQQKSLDEIFRQSLGDYREAPPAAAWEKVAARLDEDDRKRPKGSFWPWSWIVLILLLTIGGGWFLAARYQATPNPEHPEQQFTASHESDGASYESINGNASGASSAELTRANAHTASNEAAAQTPDDKATSDKKTESNEKSPAADPTIGKQKQNQEAKPNAGKKSGFIPTSTAKNNSSNQQPLSTNNTDAPIIGKTSPSEEATDIPASRPDQAVGISGTTHSKNSGKPHDNASENEGLIEPKSTSTKSSSKSASAEKQQTAKGSASADPVLTSGASEHFPEKAPTGTSKKTGRNKAENVPAKENAGPKSIAVATEKQGASAAHKAGSSTKAGSNKTKKNPASSAASPSTTGTDPLGTPAPKPTASSTTATPGRTKDSVPALAKAGPPARSTQRKPGNAMTAVSPSFEESKAKQELSFSEPVPPPKAATETAPAAKNDAEGSKETLSATGADSASTGGEGAGASEPKARTKPSFSLAVQGGFEFAMQKPAPNQVSGGFRLLWHFDPGISVGIQPSIRYGNVAHSGTPGQTYQQSTPVTVDSLITLDSMGQVNSRIYFPKQTFDSIIVAGISAGGPIWQFEIPIILNYKFGKGWYAYGGPSVTFGGKIDHTSGDIQKHTIFRKDTLTAPAGTVLPPRPPSSFANYFGTSTLPEFSTYQPSSNEWKDPMSLRFGYLVGLGYEHKRLMFDVSLHQQISGYSEVMQPFQKVYSTPYVRIGVGWKIFPEKTKK